MNATATPRPANDAQIDAWVNTLQSDSLTAERQQAQHNLELAGPAAVPSLLVALRSNNPTMRQNAAEMLGYIAAPAATEGLLNTLRLDRVPAVRRNAAYALGQNLDARAFGELQQAATADRSQIVRGTAADSLARLRTLAAKSANVNEQTVGAIATSEQNPALVYLAAKRDLYTSTDSGKTWQSGALVLPSQVSALAVNPQNSQELYAGVDGLGMFKSSDGGATWQTINNGITLTPGAREVVSAIAIDSANPNRLYITRGVWVGTGTVDYYPLGLMQSADGGMSWQAVTTGSDSDAIIKLTFRNGQLYGLAGDRVLTLITPR